MSLFEHAGWSTSVVDSPGWEPDVTCGTPWLESTGECIWQQMTFGLRCASARGGCYPGSCCSGSVSHRQHRVSQDERKGRHQVFICFDTVVHSLPYTVFSCTAANLVTGGRSSPYVNTSEMSLLLGYTASQAQPALAIRGMC